MFSMMMMMMMTNRKFRRISMFEISKMHFRYFGKYIDLNANTVGGRQQKNKKNASCGAQKKYSTPAVTKWRSLRVGVAEKRGRERGGEERGATFGPVSGNESLVLDWPLVEPVELISYAVRLPNVIIQYILRALHAKLWLATPPQPTNTYICIVCMYGFPLKLH